MMQGWLREPLVHFLALGGLLFGIAAYVGGPDQTSDTRILITMDDVERLVALWESQWNRPPSPHELSGLLDEHIREEVLFREAMAMGLDRDDTVIRRRLAQKMAFLSADLADQAAPTEAELQAWLQANVDRYRQPPVVSLVHVYLNPDIRGSRVAADAASLLSQLRQTPDPVDPGTLGDRFMLPHEYEGRTTDDLDRQFGEGFGAALIALDVGTWQGPIRSGFGLHLVRVDARTESDAPTLDQVRRLVERDVMSSRRDAMNDAFYGQLRSRYEIVMDDEIRDLATGPPAREPPPASGKDES